MKITVRRKASGWEVYVAKKDLEEPVVAMEHPGFWGGWVELGNGWRFEIPPLPADTTVPLTLDARKLAGE